MSLSKFTAIVCVAFHTILLFFSVVSILLTCYTMKFSMDYINNDILGTIPCNKTITYFGPEIGNSLLIRGVWNSQDYKRVIPIRCEKCVFDEIDVCYISHSMGISLNPPVIDPIVVISSISIISVSVVSIIVLLFMIGNNVWQLRN